MRDIFLYGAIVSDIFNGHVKYSTDLKNEGGHVSYRIGYRRKQDDKFFTIQEYEFQVMERLYAKQQFEKAEKEGQAALYDISKDEIPFYWRYYLWQRLKNLLSI